MSSSTSSSERGIAASAIGLAALLLCGYGFLVHLKLLPDGRGLDQEQANNIRLERYLYDSQKQPQNVLVGSSLAYNIHVERIDSSFDNLGLAAGCSQTGLAVIAAAEKKPRRVFVEISELIRRKEDEELVEEMTHPLKSWVRRRVPAFQQRFQPINVAITAMKEKFLAAPPSGTDPALRETLVESRLRDAQAPLPEEHRLEYMEQLESIAVAAARLRSEGVEVVFVHIPIEPVLEQSTRYREVAELTRTRIPSGAYRWLPEIQGRQWITNDGVHLAGSDADTFARHLSDYAKTTLEPDAANPSR